AVRREVTYRDEPPYWSARRMTRRRALSGAAVGSGILGLGAAGITGAACRAPDSPVAVVPAATPMPSPTPGRAQAGGVMRALGGPFGAIPDPHKTRLSAEASIWQWVANFLVRFDSKAPYLPQPDLAAALPEIPDDGTTFLFKLRPEARWQNLPPVNGRGVTAEDVKATFERIRAPGTKSPRAGNYANVESITVVDNLTVQFKLKAPQADLLNVIADQYDVVIPKEIAAKGDAAITTLADVIGSGPYQLTAYEPGERAQLKRRADGYWRASAAWLDEWDLLDVEDPGVAANMLLAGTAEVADCPPALAHIFDGNAAFQVLRTPSAARECLLINHTVPKWNDPRVRLGAWRAIDRKQLYAAAFQGEGRPAGPMSPAAPAWALSDTELSGLPGFGDRASELKEAKLLLSAAGLQDGFDAALLTVSAMALDAVAVAVVKNLAEVGIRAAVENVGEDLNVLTERARAGNFTLMTTLLLAGIYPDAQLYVYHRTGAAANFGRYSNPPLDAKLDQQRVLYDVLARTALVKEIQRDIINAPGPVWLGSRTQLQAVSRRVHGIVGTPFVSGYDDAENDWLG
ncbi:MAG TPA: ABC transporter substrate-binding protein, partial [Tepidiformaceae bacterium]|nr:ABC transporter substrate-binding protein [Tepidiformaceae bacterium]